MNFGILISTAFIFIWVLFGRVPRMSCSLADRTLHRIALRRLEWCLKRDDLELPMSYNHKTMMELMETYSSSLGFIGNNWMPLDEGLYLKFRTEICNQAQ